LFSFRFGKDEADELCFRRSPDFPAAPTAQISIRSSRSLPSEHLLRGAEAGDVQATWRKVGELSRSLLSRPMRQLSQKLCLRFRLKESMLWHPSSARRVRRFALVAPRVVSLARSAPKRPASSVRAASEGEAQGVTELPASYRRALEMLAGSATGCTASLLSADGKSEA